MSVSLKVAARRFLKWNIEGQKHATPKRGGWIELEPTPPGRPDKCVACKIGLVMIGRYGLTPAMDLTGWDGRLDSTLGYGAMIECPAPHRTANKPDTLHGHEWRDGKGVGLYVAPLGLVVEHLFEFHLWGVKKIDEWLSVLAGQGVFVDA